MNNKKTKFKNLGFDYNGELLKPGDRVRSIYTKYESNNIGTITDEGFIIYDDEPETEYRILDSRYLIKIKATNIYNKEEN